MKKLIIALAFLALAAVTRGDLLRRFGNPIYETFDTGAGGKHDAPYRAEEFRKKYGEPVSETYQVQLGITVTATYKTDGNFKELKIAAQSLQSLKSQEQFLQLRKVLEELVPLRERGKYTEPGFGTFPGNTSAFRNYEVYEKLTIYFYSGGGIPAFILIRWKL